MPSSPDDLDRNVVPRWRTFAATRLRGELAPCHESGATRELSGELLADRIREWQEHHTLTHAADAVCCAIAHAAEDQVGEAAQYIKNSTAPGLNSLRGLAEAVLRPESRAEELVTALPSPPPKRIAALRRLLSVYPRAAFQWIDMALAHETLGQREHARRCVEVALGLAPNDRFVLRSACRLFLHHNDYDRAHHVLVRSERTTKDPWLLASEIAVAPAAGRTSAHVKRGIAMLEQGSYLPLHCSELASAIGTLELKSGRRGRGKSMIKRSLVDPSENSVAQAAWLVRRQGIALNSNDLAKLNSDEACAWSAWAAADWAKSMESARRWLNDQPFSIRPAAFASYVAAVCIGDHTESLGMAQLGLIANPADFLLLNNQAVALANCGRVREAVRAVEHIKSGSLGEREKPVYDATLGLIQFRTGKPDRGRTFYLDAIEAARKLGDKRLEVLALLHLALEELRSRTPEAEMFRNRAIHEAEKLPLPDLRALCTRVRAYSAVEGESSKRT